MPDSPSFRFSPTSRPVRRHPLRWALPAIVVASAASLYAVTKPATWEAGAHVTVRAERPAIKAGPAGSAISPK